MISLATFMGGGRDLGEVQGNVRVMPGAPRVLVVTPIVADLMLTFHTGPYGGAGGPKHIIVNEGLHDIEVIDETGQSIGTCRRQSDTIVFAVTSRYFPGQLFWSISDAEGGVLQGSPIRISSTTVLVSTTNLRVSYSW